MESKIEYYDLLIKYTDRKRDRISLVASDIVPTIVKAIFKLHGNVKAIRVSSGIKVHRISKKLSLKEEGNNLLITKKGKKLYF